MRCVVIDERFATGRYARATALGNDNSNGKMVLFEPSHQSIQLELRFVEVKVEQPAALVLNLIQVLDRVPGIVAKAGELARYICLVVRYVRSGWFIAFALNTKTNPQTETPRKFRAA